MIEGTFISPLQLKSVAVYSSRQKGLIRFVKYSNRCGKNHSFQLRKTAYQNTSLTYHIAFDFECQEAQLPVVISFTYAG